MRPLRSLVVTGADELFTPLLKELVLSLHQWQPRPFTDLAVFDLGLAADTRSWLGRYAQHVVEPGWDLPVADAQRVRQPATRALTVRPFLPRYFPGYDVYLWLDADTWVQRADAVPIYLKIAASGRLAAATSADRAYRHPPVVLRWRLSRMDACFGAGCGQRALMEPYLNAGAFALTAAAPHWQVWAETFEAGLRATGGELVCDQSALNQAVWTRGLPLCPLPAWLNWQCHLATPRHDSASGLWMEPHAPAQPIGVMHLTATTKDLRVRDADSGPERSLRYATKPGS